MDQGPFTNRLFEGDKPEFRSFQIEIVNARPDDSLVKSEAESLDCPPVNRLIKSSQDFRGGDRNFIPTRMDTDEPLVTRSANKERLRSLKKMVTCVKEGKPLAPTEPGESKELQKLRTIILKMDRPQRIRKAARHFKDAIHLRSLRNDIDLKPPKVIRLAYFIQSSVEWQKFMCLITWGYMILSAIDPAYKNDPDYYNWKADYYPVLLALESVFLFLYIMDIVMAVIHRVNDNTRTNKEKFWWNKRFMGKVIVLILLLIDFSVFHARKHMGNELVVRWATAFRPLMLFFHSRNFSHNMEGILRTFSKMMDLCVIFILFALCFTIVAVRIFTVDEDTDYNEFFTMTPDFGRTLNILWVYLFAEGYPDVMFPHIFTNKLYLLFFLPYLAAGILIWNPIPVAIFFNGFKFSRSKKAITDRLKEREALFACFFCIHSSEKGRAVVRIEEFTDLMNKLIDDAELSKICIQLFNMLDQDGNGYLELEEFFILPELMLNDLDILSTMGSRIKFWEQFERGVRRVFRLHELITSKFYAWFIVFISIWNIVNVAISYFSRQLDDGQYIKVSFWILTGIYGFDIIARAFGHGIRRFWIRDLNKLDIAMFIIGMVVGTFHTPFGRLYVSLNIIFETKGKPKSKLRVPLLLQPLYDGIIRLKKLIENVYACLPMVIELIAFIVIMTYLYGFIAANLFNKTLQRTPPPSVYMPANYHSFDDIPWAMFSLCQLMAQQVWSNLQHDIATRFDYSYYGLLVYFDSFHFLVNIVLINIIKGLIWEFFTVVEENKAEQEKIMQKDVTPMSIEKLKHRQSSIFFSSKEVLEQEKHIIQLLDAENKRVEIAEDLEHEMMYSEHYTPSEVSPTKVKGITKPKVFDVALGSESKRFPASTLASSAIESVFNTKASENNTFKEPIDPNHPEAKFYRSKFQLLQKAPTTADQEELVGSIDSAHLKPKEGEDSDNEDIDNFLEKNYHLNFEEFSEQPNDDLVQKREKLLASNLNQNLIMRKALMKEINQEVMDKYEDKYFMELYGEEFNHYKKRPKVYLQSLISISSRITLELQRAARNSLMKASEFGFIIYLIEEALNFKLLPHGSVAKLIFQTADGRCFVLRKRDKKATYLSVKDGPWKFKEQQVFVKSGEIYHAKNIFDDNDDANNTEIVDKLFHSLFMISCCTSSSFDRYERTEGIWDMIITPIGLGYTKDLQRELKKEFQKDQQKLSTKIDIESCAVTKIYFSVCVKTAKRLLTDNLAIDKRPMMQSNKKLAVKMTEDIMLADTDHQNTDKLPMSEIFDLVKDWKSIVEGYKENICRKASHLYLKRKFETQIRRQVEEKTNE